jgi:tetratricopeptide (TPR) repeat protein
MLWRKDASLVRGGVTALPRPRIALRLNACGELARKALPYPRSPVQAELQRRTWLNAAGCLLHLQLPAQAEEACTHVIEAHPRAAKALYRRSVARAALGRWHDAEDDARRALCEEPQSPAILAHLRKVPVSSRRTRLCCHPGALIVGEATTEPIHALHTDPTSPAARGCASTSRTRPQARKGSLSAITGSECV